MYAQNNIAGVRVYLPAVSGVVEVSLGVRVRHPGRVTPDNVEVCTSIHPSLAVPLHLLETHTNHTATFHRPQWVQHRALEKGILRVQWSLCPTHPPPVLHDAA